MQRDRDCYAYVIDMYRSKRALYTGKRGLGMVYCLSFVPRHPLLASSTVYRLSSSVYRLTIYYMS